MEDGDVTVGGASSTTALAHKVRLQALELSSLTQRLRNAESYSNLVERRLVEVVPDHPLPVATAHMGATVSSLSKLCATGERHGRDDVKRLERTLAETRFKLNGALDRVRELKLEVTTLQRDRATVTRRCDAATQRIVSLEAELRARPATAHHVGTTAAGAVGGSSGTTLAGEELKLRIQALEAEIATVSATRDETDAALQRESVAHAHARAYITTLERAVHARYEEDAGRAALVLNVARLEGEVQVLRSDAVSREETITALTARLKEATTVAAASTGAATPSRQRGGGGGEVQVTSPLLGEISTTSHNRSRITGAATTLRGGEGELTVARLEAEKAALLDYVSDLRNVVAQREHDATVAQEAARVAQGELRVARGEVHETAHARGDAEARVAALKAQVAEAQTAAAAAQAQLRDVKERHAAASASASENSHAVEEMKAVQEELLGTIREKSDECDRAVMEAEEAKRTCEDAKRRLARAEDMMTHIEMERDSVVRQLRETQDALDGMATRAAEVEIARDNMQARITSLEADMSSTSDALSRARSELQSLSHTHSRANSQLAEARAQVDALTALQSAQSSVSERLSQAERVLVQLRADGGELPVEPLEVVREDTGSATQGEASASSLMALCARVGKAAVSKAEQGMAVCNDAHVATSMPAAAHALRAMARALKAAGDTLTDAATRFRGISDDARAQRHILYDEIHTLRRDCERARNDAATATATLEQARASMSMTSSQFEADMSSMKRQVASATAEVERLTAALDARAQEVQGLHAELGQTRGRLDTATTQLDSINALKDSTARMAETAQVRVAALTTEAQELTARIRGLEAAAHTHDAEKRALVDRVCVLEDSVSAADARARDALAQRDKATADVAGLQSDVAALSARVREHETAHADARAANHSQSKRVHTLKAELSQAAALAEAQNNAISDMEQSIKRLTEDRSALQKSIGGITTELNTVTHNLDSLMRSLHDAAESGVSACSRMGVDIPSNARGNDVKLLAGLLDSTLARVRAVNDEAAQLRSDVASMRARVDGVESVAESADSNSRALALANETISQLRATVSVCETRASVAESEAAALKSRVTDAARDGDRVRTRLAALVQEVQQHRDAELRARTDLAAAQDRLTALEDEVAHSRARADALTHAHARLEARTSNDTDMVSQLSADLDAERRARSRAEAAVASMRESSTRLQQECEDARAESVALSERVSELTHAVRDREAHIAELQAQLQTLAMLHARLESRMPGLAHEAEEVHAAHDAIAERLASQSHALAETRDTLAKRTQELEVMRATRVQPSSTLNPVTAAATGRAWSEAGGQAGGSATLSSAPMYSTVGGITTAPARTLTVSRTGSIRVAMDAPPVLPQQTYAAPPVAPPSSSYITYGAMPSMAESTYRRGSAASTASGSSQVQPASARGGRYDATAASVQQDSSGVDASLSTSRASMDDGGDALQQRLRAVQARFQSLRSGASASAGQQ